MSCQAFEEFATLWLDQFDQETLPADTVQVLCALTSSSKHVPARVPKRHLAARWRKKAEELLHHHSLLSKSEISTWHFAADDLLDTTQRMSKLAAKDAVYLGRCTFGMAITLAHTHVAILLYIASLFCPLHSGCIFVKKDGPASLR